MAFPGAEADGSQHHRRPSMIDGLALNPALETMI
jgi:hypothetical protein